MIAWVRETRAPKYHALATVDSDAKSRHPDGTTKRQCRPARPSRPRLPGRPSGSVTTSRACRSAIPGDDAFVAEHSPGRLEVLEDLVGMNDVGQNASGRRITAPSTATAASG